MGKTWRTWLIGASVLAGCTGSQAPAPAPSPTPSAPASTTAAAPEPAAVPAAAAETAAGGPVTEAGWVSLFDGADLGAWRTTTFGGAGEVTVVDGAIRIPMGVDLAGVTFGGEFPTQDYELALDARRVDGNDFFCGLTFPVGDECCSLILGGWGGSIVGLSSIDGLDAANNGTTQAKAFDKDRWYAIRVKVTPVKIECWLDDERIIDQPIENRRISVRDEVIPSKPLGIATYSTVGEARNIRFKRLPVTPTDDADGAPAP